MNKINKKYTSAKKTILVVDDEFDVVNAIKLWLQKHQCSHFLIAED